MEFAVIAMAALVTGLVARALHRQRQGWYADHGDRPVGDAHAAVNRNSWMLGGGGGGGGG